MPVILSIESVSYVAAIFFAITYLYIILHRPKIKWGTARRMGITMTIFAWMNIISGLVLGFALLRVVYAFVSFIFDWPIWMNWIDFSLSLVVMMLSLWLYLKLLPRENSNHIFLRLSFSFLYVF